MGKLLLASLTANLTAVALLLAALLFIYVTFVPVEVLKVWKITIPDKTYTAGEELVITSEYEKTRSVSGVAHQYVECLNINGAYRQYHVSQSNASNGAGRGKVDTALVIPQDIPNLPTTCRVFLSVDYTVFSFRKVTHTARSMEFTLTPRTEEQ